MRSTDGHEQTLGSYELFRRNEPLDETVWDKLMLGLSTRNYGKMIRQFAAAYGIEKSAVSEHFVLVSRRKVRQLLERDLSEHNFCAIYIDGIEYQGQHLIVALGVNNDGVKTVLGLRQGASENTVVVSALLGDLAKRGVDFSEPRLYVLDGARALVKAVREHAGEEVLIQRCQLHKRRNVVGHLREEDRQAVEARLAAAYALRSTEEAQQALEQLHRELQELNPSAARSLAEGLDETLTGEPPAVAGLAAADIVDDESDRVGVLCGRDGLPTREVLAAGRSLGALGGLGAVGGRGQLPQGHRAIGTCRS